MHEAAMALMANGLLVVPRSVVLSRGPRRATLSARRFCFAS